MTSRKKFSVLRAVEKDIIYLLNMEELQGNSSLAKSVRKALGILKER